MRPREDRQGVSGRPERQRAGLPGAREPRRGERGSLLDPFTHCHIYRLAGDPFTYRVTDAECDGDAYGYCDRDADLYGDGNGYSRRNSDGIAYAFLDAARRINARPE